MRNDKKKSGPMEYVFPILLFLIFTLSALFIILFAAQIYQKIVDNSSRNYSANTALAYVTEKVRQADDSDGVEVGKFHDADALFLHNNINDVDYIPYIYFADGKLYEMTTDASRVSDMAIGSGTAILDLVDFTIQEDAAHLISFHCTDSSGNTSDAMVAVCTE